MDILPSFRAFGRHWLWVVTASALAVVVSFAESLPWSPIGKRHPWLPWVTFIVLWSLTWATAYVRAWNREHKKAVLYEDRNNRYRSIPNDWASLDSVYRDWAKQQPHAPASLPEPMSQSHWQLQDLEFRYRVGVLQARTNALLDDAETLGVTVSDVRDVRSVSELLEHLHAVRLPVL